MSETRRSPVSEFEYAHVVWEGTWKDNALRVCMRANAFGITVEMETVDAMGDASWIPLGRDLLREALGEILEQILRKRAGVG
jgi:hypothetical protein